MRWLPARGCFLWRSRVFSFAPHLDVAALMDEMRNATRDATDAMNPAGRETAEETRSAITVALRWFSLGWIAAFAVVCLISGYWLAATIDVLCLVPLAMRR